MPGLLPILLVVAILLVIAGGLYGAAPGLLVLAVVVIVVAGLFGVGRRW